MYYFISYMHTLFTVQWKCTARAYFVIFHAAIHSGGGIVCITHARDRSIVTSSQPIVTGMFLGIRKRCQANYH